MVGDLLDGFAEIMEAVAELLAQGCLLVPTQGLAWALGLQVQQFADGSEGDLKLLGQGSQVAVELSSESQDLLAVVGQELTDRLESVWAEVLAGLQFGDDEIEQSATV